MRKRRVAGFAAIVMLLLELGASLLVSAGSPHHEVGGLHHEVDGTYHEPGPWSTAVTGDAAVPQPNSHEHKHGNDWAPTLGKRLRPAVPATLVGTVATQLSAVEPAARPAEAPGLFLAPTDVLRVLGVLRV